MSKKTTGIGAILGIVLPLAKGILSKKTRDAETPKGAGRLRDFGTIAMMGGAANAISPELLNLPLDPDQQILLNAITVAAGAILHFWGIGKKKVI